MALTNFYIFDIYIIYIILQCILFRTWLLIFTRWYGAVVSAPAWYWELVGSNPAWGVPLTNVYCHIFYFFVTFIFCTFYSNKLYSLWLGLKNIFDIFLQYLSNILPDHLPPRLRDYRLRFNHYLIIVASDTVVKDTRNLLNSLCFLFLNF